jgi:uncharacterized membrane protein
MLFTQIRRWRRVGGTGFEEVEDRVADTERHHVVAGFDLAFLFHGHPQALGIEAPHIGQLSRHQRDVVEPLVSEHPMILAKSPINPAEKRVGPGNFSVPRSRWHDRAWPGFVDDDGPPAGTVGGVAERRYTEGRMANFPDGRLRRGLCVALICFSTFAMPAAAGAGTSAFWKSHSEQAASQPAQQQQGSATPATNGQPEIIQPSPVKADAKEEPNQQTGGLSADAQESFRAQMRELQEHLEEVNVRAKTAKTGLVAIESDMASQGLGMRSDVLEAEARLNNLIGKAQREIASGDAVSAEQDMQMAGYSIDFIERFLGR